MVGTLGLYALMRLPGAERLTAEEACVFFGLAFFLLLLSRASVREITTSMLSPERLLLVGGGPYAQLLIDKVRRNRDYGIEPIAYVGDPAGGVDIPCLGDFERLEQACRITRAERVLFVAPALDDATLEDLVRRTSRLNVKIGILPHVVDALGPSLEIDHVQGVTVLGISPPELSTSSWFLKRTMDISVAAVALAVAMPVMLLVAACIKLTSPGPVLFSQERVGRRGSRFRIRKFRTMVQDAEAQESRLRPLSAHPAWLLLADDPRITRLGRVLRHTSLDELPQLWNVLVGDMSLVGPRPMPPMVDAQIQGWQRRRLDLTPGVTGLWQVLGRTDLAFEEMLKLDYLYVTNWSLWQDVKLLVQTLPVVIRRTGAN
jgi:exopolysaccharide biosynthesis polyprenyl glycosylphosphotransferase